MTAAGMRAAADRRLDGGLLVAGVLVFGAVLGWYAHLAGVPSWWLVPVDMTVYRDAGEIVRQVPPFFNPRNASPLYQWGGPPHLGGLRFTYPPFAALLFAPLSYVRTRTLAQLAAVADVLAIVLANWIIFGSIGLDRGARRAGVTLLASAAVLFTEPVQRTIYLGQIDLLLMLLVIWDLCQPSRRWWQGAGVGIAAGTKLVPLIFIPYLLLTRRFRQAAVAAAAFALTVAAGFAVLPRDSARFWLQGLFLQDKRAGTIYWNGNQSLLGLISRAGAGNVQPQWLIAAILTGLAGLACAALLDRAGHRMPALATCALTALLISPISWDHHWVWIVLAVPVLTGYAIRLRGLARWVCAGLAVAVTTIFGAWPTALWGEKIVREGWTRGIIWAPPSAGTAEYRWHGVQLLTGNAYVLTGLALLIGLVILAITLDSRRRTRPQADVTGAPRLSKA